MDALALLCNLHGDGPVTLAALREVGCADLIGLEGLGDLLLADLIGRDERGVQRFRREARLLLERLEGEVETPVAAPPTRIAGPDPEPAAVEREPVDASGRGPVVQAVLAMWRSFDDHVQAAATSNLLTDSELNGLRPAEAEALAQAGVQTLEDLADADVLALSRETGLPYTHLAHLAFLAKKRSAESGTMIPVGRPAAVREGPRSEPLQEEGAAGPFA